MVRIACSVKLHAFQVAEQLNRLRFLDKFYTIYHSEFNTITALFNKRRDKEDIPADKIKTFPYLAPLFRFRNNPFLNNSFFDSLVAADLAADKNYEAYIGWSGMSLKSMRQAKKDGKKLILERSSSHIRFQFALLKDEYERWGYIFKGDPRVADQEELEYELADFVSIPSGFVEQTFLDNGFSKAKLFRNNFGSNAYFSPTQPRRQKFTILYLGNLSLRKGLPYLFNALHQLHLDPNQYDVWFIGKISDEIKPLIAKYQQSNWKFFGHVNHYSLSDMISQCHVAVQPSLEEGMSLVIPQFMSCGTPVIATTNTGGGDVIADGINGYIIPIRSPEIIAEKLTTLFTDKELLRSMQENALLRSRQLGSWDQYGERYVKFLSNLINR